MGLDLHSHPARSHLLQILLQFDAGVLRIELGLILLQLLLPNAFLRLLMAEKLEVQRVN